MLAAELVCFPYCERSGDTVYTTIQPDSGRDYEKVVMDFVNLSHPMSPPRMALAHAPRHA